MPLKLHFNPFPELHTDRFVLQKITKKHTQDMYTLRSHPDVMAYIPRKKPQNLENALQHIEYMQQLLDKNECINWGIFFKNTNKLIGYIGFFNIETENFRAEIGYMLHKDYHRQGIMQEVLKSVVNYGFNEMKLHSITAIVTKENKGSWLLLEKFGFNREGHLKEHLYWNNMFWDSYIYSLLNI